MTRPPPRPDQVLPPAGLSLDGFSDIVGSIYECALEPRLWADVVARICNEVGGPAGWIGVHEPRQVRSVYQVEAGTDPTWQKRLREEFVAISPFIGASHHFQVGEVFGVDDVVDYDEFLQSRFYREWAGPQGWPDNLFGILTKSADRFAWLSVCLPVRADLGHKQRLAAFLPHLSRALRISDLLDYRAAQAADLVAAVAGLPTGLILVDEQLNVRGANPAAERLMRETGALSGVAGRLAGAGDGGIDLRAALNACAAGALDQGGRSVLFPAEDGGPGLLVQVLPLPRPKTAADGHAVAALFLTRPTAPQPAPVEAAVRHYGLTPSETRVLVAMLGGQTPKEIAAAVGVGMPTVRTHLSRLYDKTGASGQTDLVRLMAALTGGA